MRTIGFARALGAAARQESTRNLRAIIEQYADVRRDTLASPASSAAAVLSRRVARLELARRSAARVFLTRQEATYRFGLMDAAHRKEPLGFKVACRDRRTGEVFEAEAGEVLHCEIAIRVGRTGGGLQDGWTAPVTITAEG